MSVSLEEYRALDINVSSIGLESHSSYHVEQFCTPKGTVPIGWEGNICYCFIEGFGETVFAVNPESCADSFVYPLANSLEDFLRLVLAGKGTTAIEQIVWWTREQFDGFLVSDSNVVNTDQLTALDVLSRAFELEPLDDPYSYVKAVQACFDGSRLEFSDEYYDVLGLEPPDGRLTGSDPVEFEAVQFMFHRTQAKEIS